MDNVLTRAGKLLDSMVKKDISLKQKIDMVEEKLSDLFSRESIIKDKELELSYREKKIESIEDVVKMESDAKIEMSNAITMQRNLNEDKKRFDSIMSEKRAEVAMELNSASTQKAKYENMVASLSKDLAKLKSDKANFRKVAANKLINEAL